MYEDYPLYLAEAIDRWHSYPPSYYGYYVIPWLWYDGNPHLGKTFSVWEDSIVSRMNQPSVVTITLNGYYSSSGNGMISAQFRNDTTVTINGRALFVITEDSIYYVGPNKDSIHNHVARDFLPNPLGVGISIPPGDSATIDMPFSIQPRWNVNNCNMLVWLQDTILTSDSVKNVYQGSFIKISSLDIKENNPDMVRNQMISVMPNPCSEELKFKFHLPAGAAYSITLFDVLGRMIRNLHGRSQGISETIVWHCKNQNGFMVHPGIYFYKADIQGQVITGKVIIR